MGLALVVFREYHNNNTLPRVLGMLSELATCLYALTMPRGIMVWALGVVSSEVSDPDVAVQQCGARPGERILSESEGLGGLGPGRPRNIQVCGG